MARLPMALLRGLLRFLSSVRVGIALLVLLFIYMSVGSAGIVYPVHPNLFHPDAWVHAQLRQWRLFEMTEFEWFHWWPFDLLIGLIAATMIVTTVRRIPFRPVNYGVWTIHAGILVLILGSVIYFEQKVEGDAPVARRKVVVRVDGVVEPVELLASAGSRAVVGTGGNRREIEVVEVDPNWEIRTTTEAGRVAYSVTVSVTGASGRFMRQLIAGHPEFTEDLLITNDPKQPVKRAIKERGTAIVDATVSMALEYESQSYLYLRNDLAKAWAIYVRPVGSGEWTMRRADGIPLYNDRISSSADVFGSDESHAAMDPMAVRVPAAPEGDPFPDVELSIEGYLRYAETRSRLVAGGSSAPLNPTVEVRVASPDGAQAEYRLVASDPERATADGGLIRMVHLASEDGLKSLTREATVRIAIPGALVDVTEPVRGHTGEGEAPFATIGDPELGYSYRVLAAQDNLPVGSRTASVLIVDLKTPTRTIRRWVFDDPSLTRDIPEGADAHAMPGPPDESVVMEYFPGGGRSLVTVVTGPSPERLRIVSAIGDGEAMVHEAAVRTPIEIGAGLRATIVSYEPRAVIETRPIIVAPEERIRDAREMFAQVLVAAPGGDRRWVEFSLYAVDNARFALPRHPFHPARLKLADGREMEVLFSRERLPLKTEAALEDFVLTTHDGGYTGEQGSIRNYTSMIRFRDTPTASWTASVAVSVNDPVEHNGYWYFQAQWDPPEGPSARSQRGSPGLNYTVLGVGNREGVWIQLSGCVIAVLGMAYAFYVKPVIIRRRMGQARGAPA